MTQTPLHLRIVNLTSLPDGGPLEVSVAPGGLLEAGRDSGLDWCLPDPQRFISSRHFEIRSEKGRWMLYDLSTNGTFINGATNRVKSPCPLHDGDRLQVGQYSIEIRHQPALTPAPLPQHAGLAAPPAQISTPPRPAARSLPGGLDPWAVQPASTTEPEPVSVPPYDPGPRPEPPGGAARNIWAMPQGEENPPQTGPQGPMPDWINVPMDQRGTPLLPAQPEPVHQIAPAQQTAPPIAEVPVYPPVSQPSGPTAQNLLEVIESAAGLASGTLSRGDARVAAQEIGETLRALTEELSGLLQARAVARRSVRSAQVTMIGREDNNPLKFMPTPDQALGVMFGPPRPGFQRGPAAVRAGFADIKTHQYATHAALQPALAQLLDDLSPQAIEKRLDGVRLNRKSRAWETYVERWEAKTHAHDNGMLDVFLAHFAEAYDRESGRGG